MSKLPKVKAFIKENAKDYGVQVDYGRGKPRLVFYDENDKELEVINIEQEDRKSIGKILEDHGFTKNYSGALDNFDKIPKHKGETWN